MFYVTEGGEAATVVEVKSDLEAHQPFDKFHSLKILNETVDEVQRQEQQTLPELRRT